MQESVQDKINRLKSIVNTLYDPSPALQHPYSYSGLRYTELRREFNDSLASIAKVQKAFSASTRNTPIVAEYTRLATELDNKRRTLECIGQCVSSIESAGTEYGSLEPSTVVREVLRICSEINKPREVIDAGVYDSELVWGSMANAPSYFAVQLQMTETEIGECVVTLGVGDDSTESPEAGEDVLQCIRERCYGKLKHKLELLLQLEDMQIHHKSSEFDVVSLRNDAAKVLESKFPHLVKRQFLQGPGIRAFSPFVIPFSQSIAPNQWIIVSGACLRSSGLSIVLNIDPPLASTPEAVSTSLSGEELVGNVKSDTPQDSYGSLILGDGFKYSQSVSDHGVLRTTLSSNGLVSQRGLLLSHIPIANLSALPQIVTFIQQQCLINHLIRSCLTDPCPGEAGSFIELSVSSLSTIVARMHVGDMFLNISIKISPQSLGDIIVELSSPYENLGAYTAKVLNSCHSLPLTFHMLLKAMSK